MKHPRALFRALATRAQTILLRVALPRPANVSRGDDALVESVAEAIFRRDVGRDRDFAPHGDEVLAEHERDDYRYMAEAAILALRKDPRP